MTARGGLWLAGGASVRGPSHERTGKPNEDAVAWRPEQGAAERVFAAVSDGHGAAPHFRSEIGSRLAVERALELLAWRLGDVSDDDEGGDPAFAHEMVAAWRQAVDRHLAANPVDGMDATGSERFTPYGATLLAVAASESAITLVQIGDGDLMLGYPDGRVERPLGEDTGLVGEQTYSLCLVGAERRFRVASLWRSQEDWPDFISLSSDGVSKSFPDDAGFLAAIKQFRELSRTGWADLQRALPGWLTDVSTHGSGDDCTLCLLKRPDAVQPGAASHDVAATPIPPPSSTEP